MTGIIFLLICWGIAYIVIAKVIPEMRMSQGKKKMEMESTTENESVQNSNGGMKENRRSITVSKWDHSHKDLSLKGLNNKLLDAQKMSVFLDDKFVGELKSGQPVIAYMDEREHKVQIVTFVKKQYIVPAGNESYYAAYFNEKLSIVPSEDRFRDELIGFVLNMFKSQGIKDRINDPNNRYHSIDIDCGNQEIYLNRVLNQGTNLAQKLTGSDSEKIPYAQIGLSPIEEYTQLPGYWYMTTEAVKEAIMHDKDIDIEEGMGGLTYRRTHDLY